MNFKKCLFLPGIIIFSIIFAFSCTTKKAVKFLKKPIPTSAKIAVIIDSPENLKNVVLVQFLSRGYDVKAINASDFYSMKEIFDIKDLKRLSYKSKAENSLVSMERTYNNIYKLHIYNFELNKIEILNEIRKKLGVQYLVILDLKNWEDVCWGRAINLNNYEIVWIENYPTKPYDDIKTITENLITGMTGSE